MVIVTDKKYFLEAPLKERLDLMIKRMTQGNKDNLLLIDGNEGDGKTNMELAIAYYVAYETKREFNLDHVFFDIEKLMEFGQKTSEQIICWDEGALGGLALEWWNKNQRKFLKFLMVARKKKHFFVICIPKFFKLNEYLVVDRSIGLVHVYMRNGIEHGRFVYFNERQKEKLYQDWRKKHIRNYKMLYNFRGSFPMTMGLGIVDEKAYEDKKDIAILSIEDGKDDKVLDHVKVKNRIKIGLQSCEELGLKLTQEQLGKLFGVSDRTIWQYNKELKNEKLLKSRTPDDNNTLGFTKDNFASIEPIEAKNSTLEWKQRLENDMEGQE